jgi:ribosomal protein S15P/S13E
MNEKQKKQENSKIVIRERLEKNEDLINKVRNNPLLEKIANLPPHLKNKKKDNGSGSEEDD